MFASFNSSHRVTLRLGIITLFGVPLTVVVFGAVILGMLVMLGAGVQSDLKVRRILRARLVEEDREERERCRPIPTGSVPRVRRCGDRYQSGLAMFG